MFSKLNITAQKFYLYGFWILLIGSSANTIQFFVSIYFDMFVGFFATVGSLASVCFGWVITGFFYTLKKEFGIIPYDEDEVMKMALGE